MSNADEGFRDPMGSAVRAAILALRGRRASELEGSDRRCQHGTDNVIQVLDASHLKAQR